MKDTLSKVNVREAYTEHLTVVILITVFDLITAHTPISAQSSDFIVLKITGSVLFCLLLYKGICRLVDAIQMSTHNICIYKENQKNCIINIK